MTELSFWLKDSKQKSLQFQKQDSVYSHNPNQLNKYAQKSQEISLECVMTQHKDRWRTQKSENVLARHWDCGRTQKS